jgi:sugar phosphate isomerase/epimerase
MKDYLNKNKQKWCFSSIGCPGASLEDMLKIAVGNNVDAIELRYFAEIGKQPDYCLLKNAGKTAELFNKYDIELIMFGGNCSLIGGGTKADQEYYSIAELADKLNVKYIRIFDGLSWGDEISEAVLNEAADTINRRNAFVLERGWDVKPALETHSGFSSGAYVTQLLEKADLSIVWDIHHTIFYGQESVEETWNLLKEKIIHVHVKDSIRKASERHPYTLTLPGEGNMPMKNAIEFLKTENYCGAVSLEWEKQWHPYLPSLDMALKTTVSANWKI